MPGWFPYEIDITDSSEVRDLADILGIKPVYARGHLADLKSYVFKQFQLGIIQGRNLEIKIAEGASWTGPADQFIAALIETGFLHRSELASPELCEQCFPPKELPYDLMPGAYILHGWAALIENYLEFIERKKIKKEQDAKRQRDKYHKDKKKEEGDGPSALAVHERPRSEYVPQRRGLRAAPRIIADRFTHALESVSSRNLSREVTESSQPTSHAAFRPSAPTMPQKPVPSSLPDPTKPPIPSVNETENETYSFDRELTHTSQNPHAPKSVTSLPTNKQTEKHSSDTPVSLSLKDRESLTGGTAKKAFACASHVDCKSLFKKLFLKTTGDNMTERDEGFLDKIIARIHRGKGTKTLFTYDEIGRRMEFWFASTWVYVRKEWKFRPSQFENQFAALSDGPLEQHSNRRSTKHGQFDQPPTKFVTTDDFGTT